MILFIPKKVFQLLFALIIIGFLSQLTFSRVIHHPGESATVVFWSMLPLRAGLVCEHVTATSADPRQTLTVKISTVRFFQFSITVREQNLPRGNPVFIQAEKIPTLIPGVTKSFAKTLIPKVKPVVIKAPKEIGTRGPISIFFNTPLKEENISNFFTTEFPARIEPLMVKLPTGVYRDRSVCVITPHQTLKHANSYQISLRKGLQSLSGTEMTAPRSFQVNTVSPLKITSCSPSPGSANLSLTTRITVTADRGIQAGRVTIGDYAGETTIRGKTLSFTPGRLLLPDTDYPVIVTVTDTYGETATATWDFRTKTMGNWVWVEVNLRSPQTVTVYRGREKLRTMKASGGKSNTPTPLGTFQITGRSYAFYSHKSQEGAFYNLRFHDSFYLHSVPFGPDYQSKPDLAAGLGKPASEGCIWLSNEDAAWLYRHVPDLSRIIVHDSAETSTSKKTQRKVHQDALFFAYPFHFNQLRKK